MTGEMNIHPKSETGVSVVRRNLLTQPGYTPYCGATPCRFLWPRTTFNGSQFQCRCGWTSGFEAEFIDKYKRFKALGGEQAR